MIFKKRKRGRPRGTGKNGDIIVMLGIARLHQSNPEQSISGAVRRFASDPSDTDIRRIRRKWRAKGKAMTTNIGLVRDMLALSCLPYSRKEINTFLAMLEALPERAKYKLLDATAIIALACSIRFGSLLEEVRATSADPVLGAVRRIGRGPRNFSSVRGKLLSILTNTGLD